MPLPGRASGRNPRVGILKRQIEAVDPKENQN